MYFEEVVEKSLLFARLEKLIDYCLRDKYVHKVWKVSHVGRLRNHELLASGNSLGKNVVNHSLLAQRYLGKEAVSVEL